MLRRIRGLADYGHETVLIIATTVEALIDTRKRCLTKVRKARLVKTQLTTEYPAHLNHGGTPSLPEGCVNEEPALRSWQSLGAKQ